SVAAARIVIPRSPRIAWATVVVTGTIADLDELSSRFGASSYLHWHRSYLHSISASVIIATICAVAYLLVPSTYSKEPAPRSSSMVAPSGFAGAPLQRALLWCWLLGVSLLHLALDTFQSDGIMLLWPFSHRRIAADWLASIDPWI